MSGSLRRVLGLLVLASALALPLLRADDQPVETLVAQWAPPPSELVELNGQLLHLRDEGPRDDPVPLLLLHGTSASLHTWDGWARALKTDRRVVRIDLPAFGLTGPWSGAYAGQPYRGENYARFVRDVMDHLKLQRVVLVGNSLGGEVAWRLAALAPERVQRLVLVDTAGLRFTPGVVPLAWQVARLPVLGRLSEWLLTRALVRQGLASVVGDPARITNAQVERYYRLTLRAGNRAALVQRLRSVSPGQGVERIEGLGQPTLVLWGGRDRLIPPEVGERVAASISGSRLVRFDDLGHIPHEEDPARTVAVVRDFLAAH
jgi:pimeloyl-ACP methyl ester carboxylesterase